jgi:hypothetical protein
MSAVAVASGLGSAAGASVVAAVTAWPPNWLRNAETTFMAGESSWREVNLANNADEIAGSGTAWSIAASTVQRPSPESST